MSKDSNDQCSRAAAGLKCCGSATFQDRRTEMLSKSETDREAWLEANTEKWHAGTCSKLPLREYLGLTTEEYARYLAPR